MQIEKDVVFLGYKDMLLKDGTVLYTISLFVDDEPFTLYVSASNTEVVSVLPSLAFAANCCATFTLRKQDKLYRLSLVRLSNV